MIVADHSISLLQLLTLSSQATQDPVAACSALKTSLKLTNTTILDATHVAAASNVTTPGSCQSSAEVDAAMCRVQFVVKTTDTSSVHAEAWLPDEWFGRFLGLGNGGLGGCIDYANLNYGAGLHFASVGSDNGHDGNSGDVFLNAPEVINDFTFRAVHVEAVIGKQIVEAYYGRPHHKAYFLGCSTGGRQATRAALSFPSDFDGIVGGSPATDFNHLAAWNGLMSHDVGAPNPNASASFISPDLWNDVAAEVLRQCDELDGVKDGIITEPDDCDFRPEAIQCSEKLTSHCLTKPQVDVLREIYQPLYGLEGQLLFPRYDPGSEADGDAQTVFSGAFFSIANDWFKFAIFNDSNHDFTNFSRQDIAFGDTINPGGIATFDGDLSAFEARGGKFITFHGRRDQLIASGNSKRVYNLISGTLAMPTLDAFYRLFLIPGMDHCMDGPGAVNFGQFGTSTNAVNSSSHNVLLALVDWVENGVAPDTVTGVGANGTQRVHCRYPQRSVWNGERFVCEV